jgi:hypothetical protein
MKTLKEILYETEFEKDSKPLSVEDWILKSVEIYLQQLTPETASKWEVDELDLWVIKHNLMGLLDR